MTRQCDPREQNCRLSFLRAQEKEERRKSHTRGRGRGGRKKMWDVGHQGETKLSTPLLFALSLLFSLKFSKCNWELKRSLGVESNCGSGRGLEFSFRPPHPAAPNCLELQNQGIQHPLLISIATQAHTYRHINKNKVNL